MGSVMSVVGVFVFIECNTAACNTGITNLYTLGSISYTFPNANKLQYQ